MQKFLPGLLVGLLIGGLGTWVFKQKQGSKLVGQNVSSSASAVKKDGGKGKIVIGLSVPGTDHSWLGAIKRNAEQAAAQFGDVELVLMDAMNSSEKQMENIEALIQKRVDVIVMLPQSGKALTPAAQKIQEAGIPLIVLDRMIESEDYTSFVGGDNYGIGQAAARFLGTKLQGKGKVIEIMGLPGISVTTERHRGFAETLKSEFPEINIVASMAADFSAAKGLTVTEGLLQAHPDIDAIYSHDDDMNVGVMQALRQSPRGTKIILTGAGGSKLMMDNIQKGDTPLAASFLYNPSMAGTAINMARLYALKKGLSEFWEPEIPRSVVLRATAVTKENVDQFAHLGY